MKIITVVGARPQFVKATPVSREFVRAVALRTETEWTETVDCGWNIVLGEEARDLARFVQAIADPPLWQPLYGDGHAAERIVGSLTA